MLPKYLPSLLASFFLAATAPAQQARGPMNPDPAMPLPTAPKDTVFMDDLNWLEIRDAIALHLEGLREDGMPEPPAASVVQYVEVAA